MIRRGDALHASGTPSGERPTRVVCARCRRPQVVCYCESVTSLPTRTRVLLLQHPRERRVGIGTARMAHLSLPNSTLRVGVDFAADRVVQRAVSEGSSAHLLFPGPGARDVADLPRDETLTLVVLDGTWNHAGRLLKLNPALGALPRVSFSPLRPSDYRIRRQPAPFCVSTIEALAFVLEVLEPEAGPFERLLDPFRAMIERQERFISEVRSLRHLRSREARQAKLRA
jgi:DTW domain-containing protein